MKLNKKITDPNTGKEYSLTVETDSKGLYIWIKEWVDILSEGDNRGEVMVESYGGKIQVHGYLSEEDPGSGRFAIHDEPESIILHDENV